MNRQAACIDSPCAHLRRASSSFRFCSARFWRSSFSDLSIALAVPHAKAVHTDTEVQGYKFQGLWGCTLRVPSSKGLGHTNMSRHMLRQGTQWARGLAMCMERQHSTQQMACQHAEGRSSCRTECRFTNSTAIKSTRAWSLPGSPLCRFGVFFGPPLCCILVNRLGGLLLSACSSNSSTRSRHMQSTHAASLSEPEACCLTALLVHHMEPGLGYLIYTVQMRPVTHQCRNSCRYRLEKRQFRHRPCSYSWVCKRGP